MLCARKDIAEGAGRIPQGRGTAAGRAEVSPPPHGRRGTGPRGRLRCCSPSSRWMGARSDAATARRRTSVLHAAVCVDGGLSALASDREIMSENFLKPAVRPRHLPLAPGTPDIGTDDASDVYGCIIASPFPPKMPVLSFGVKCLRKASDYPAAHRVLHIGKLS